MKAMTAIARLIAAAAFTLGSGIAYADDPPPTPPPAPPPPGMNWPPPPGLSLCQPPGAPFPVLCSGQLVPPPQQ